MICWSLNRLCPFTIFIGANLRNVAPINNSSVVNAAVVLNQGLVSEPLLGPIEIRLPEAHDIKGVTIDFGKAYPVDFTIESDNHTVTVTVISCPISR